MKTFFQICESIIDPKRRVSPAPHEKYADMPSIEDDDYDPELRNRAGEEMDDDPTAWHRSKLGMTAQYPLAQASGKMRGFQIQSPEEYFKKRTAFDDETSYKQLADTLRSKLYSGEPMTNKEIDFVSKAIEKEYRRLASFSKRNQ